MRRYETFLIKMFRNFELEKKFSEFSTEETKEVEAKNKLLRAKAESLGINVEKLLTKNKKRIESVMRGSK